jgi:hypothetical protein
MISKKLLAIAFAMMLCAQNSFAAVGTFTGGDAGEGLDLDGVFAYAISKADANLPVTIRDAAFTPDNATPGVTLSGWPSFIDGWTNPNYGGTSNDVKLATVMNSIRHSGAVPGTGSLDLTVVPGTPYKLQMMWHEASPFALPRGFDIVVEGSIIEDNFSTGAPNTVPTSGLVFDYEFVAGDASLDIDLVGEAFAFPDTNPTFFALTLEVIPEPSTYALGAFGLVAMMAIRRRKST